jgi:Zn-dependent oligopeptidase
MDNSTWHKDVQLFSVCDAGQSQGILFLGPTTALVCGFTKPTSTKPSLLRYNEMGVSFSVFDMTIHEPESREVIKSLNVASTFNNIRSKILLFEGPEALGQGHE